MNPIFTRNCQLEKAIGRSDPWDVVIVGGGATGIGVAIDAATRGLSVLLLERSDFGKGTSSRSTKLIHGGVRYLEQWNVSLVRESLRERTLLLRNAPHVVHSLEFILPCRSIAQIGYYGIGMKMYDVLASSREFPKSQRLNKEQVLSRIPTLEPSILAGGISYSDGQFDDSRLLINMAQTAALQGATLLNSAKVISLTKSNHQRVDGVEFCDHVTNQVHRVSAKCVLNATGPFCDSIRQMDSSESTDIVAASQGIHLVLPREFFPGTAAMIVPKTKDGRVMFIIPWHDHVLLGTTDTSIPHATEEPIAQAGEIDFLLETAAEYLRVPPKRSDCLSVFVGIRPLVQSKPGTSTSKLSRDHFIEVAPSGLITITGGKWTTYRQMAQDCVDRIFEVLQLAPRACITHSLRLHGAPERSDAHFTMQQANIYGDDEAKIQSLIHNDPSLGTRLHPAVKIRGADVVWAVRQEWALTVEDVLARRCRALFLNATAAIQMANEVAGLMSKELGLDEKWKSSQVEAFSRIASNYILN